jgi:hypothetical protein
MKKMTKLYMFLLLTLTLVFSACKKDDFAINTNPDDVTGSTVDFKSVLPSAISATANVHAQRFAFLQKYLGYWSRSGSFQDDQQEETYTFTNDFNVNIWNNLFYNASNFDFVAKNAKGANAGFYEAIARIMKALNTQMLVDVYGNIPYSEAYQSGTIRTPKYDDDEVIYKDLFRQLDVAIALLNNPVATALDNNKDIITNDLVFKGDKLLWKKFANTLKLRMLMHMGNTSFAGGTEVNTFIPGANQVAEMAIITAEGSGFLDHGESAMINPGYNDTKPNPYYRFYVADETGSIAGEVNKANIFAVGAVGSSTPNGYYQYNGDPRVDKFYEYPEAPAGTTVHRGFAYGRLSASGGVNPDGTTRLSKVTGKGLLPNAASSDAWILTSVESKFLQAEAARRGLLSGSASALTNAAITESFEWLGLTPAEASTYIAGNATYPDVDFNGVSQGPGLPAGGMFTILSQKWFALNAIAPLEVWTDYRRSEINYGGGAGFPLNGPMISSNPLNTKTKIPIRLFYPQNEYSFNSASVLTQGTLDVFTGGGVSGLNRIFWDKN